MSKFAELPDGTRLEFPDETEDGVIDSVVKKHLGVSVTDQGQADAYEKGLLEPLMGMSRFFGAGTKGGVSPEAHAYASQEATDAAVNNPWSVAGGKLTAAMAPGIVAAAPLAGPAMVSGGAAALTGLGGMGAGVASGAVMAPVVGPQAGMSKYQELLNAGAPEEEATRAGTITGVGNAALNMIPIPGINSFLGRAAAGGAVNALGGSGIRAMENTQLSNEKLHSDPFDPKSMALDAVIGGLTEGVAGNRVGDTMLAKRDTPAVPKTDTELVDPNFGTRAYHEEHVRNQIQHTKNVIKEIDDSVLELKATRANSPNMHPDALERLDAKILEKNQEMVALHEENKARQEWLDGGKIETKQQELELEPTRTSTDIVQKQDPLFRSDDEAWAKYEESSRESLSSYEALRKTEFETRDILAERQALVEKPNKTLDDDLRIAELNDQYVESLVRNNPRNELKSAIDDLVGERDKDLPMLGPEDATYVRARTEQINNQLAKYSEFERRATEQVNTKQQEHPITKLPTRDYDEVDLANFEVSSDFNKILNQLSGKNPTRNYYNAIIKRLEENLTKWEKDAPFKTWDSSSVINRFKQELKVLSYLRDGKLRVNDIISAKDMSNVSGDGNATTAALDATIRLGNMRGGLQELAANSSNMILRRVANLLLNNEAIGKFTKIAYSKNPAMKSDAFAAQTKEGSSIEFNPSKKLTQTTYLHEAIHAATSGMMKAFAMGHTKFTPEAKIAMRNIADLHARLREDHFDYIVDHMSMHIQKKNPEWTAKQVRDQAENDVNHFLANDRELLAYGMTLEPFMRALDDIKMFGRPALSNMYDDIAKMLGSVDKGSQSALRELLKNGEALLKESEGKGQIHYMGFADTIDNAGSYRTVTGDVGTNAKNEFFKRFGPSVKNAYNNSSFGKMILSPHAFERFWKHPFVTKVADIVKTADRNAEHLLSRIFNGDATAVDFNNQLKSSFIIPMSKAKGQQAGSRGLEYAFNNISNKELTDIIPALNKAFAERKTILDDPNAYLAGMTPSQKEFLTEFYRASDLIYSADVARATKAGHKPPTYIPGYFLKYSTGRYHVDIMANGVMLGRKWYNSENAAKDAMTQAMKLDRTVQAIYKEKEPFTDYSGLVDALEDLKADFDANRTLNPSSYIAGKIETINLNTETVGGHHKHRGLLYGFQGNTGGTVTQMAHDFKEGTLSGIREYTKAIRAREIASSYHLEMAKMEDNLPPSNIQEVARFFIDTHLGRGSNGKIAVGLRKAIADPVNNSINNIYYSLFGKAPSNDVVESVFNSLSRFGYNMTLTTRPVTWLAQMMSTMNSMRMAAQMTSNPITATLAGFTGIGKTMFKSYDADAMAGLQYIAQNTDLFHKTIAHDIQTAEGFNSTMSKFETPRKLVTGETMTEWSDSFSRVASWRIALEILKSQGKTGKEAWLEAADMMTQNLMPMGRQHLPRMYKELGFVGAAIAPLKSYTTGLASNLAADVKQVGVSLGKGDLKGLSKDSYILSMNIMSIMLQGGLLGAPFLADYEFLRQAAVKAGWIKADSLPNFTEIAMSQPRMMSHGAISAMTNGTIDLGSSNRYRSIFQPLGEATSINIAASMPLSVATNFAGGATTVARDMIGNVPDPAARSAWDKVLPGGFPRGIKEDLYNQDNMVPFGQRGAAMTGRGTPERVAKYLGSSSMTESEMRTKRTDMDLKKDSLVKEKQRATDLLLSRSQSDKEAGLEIARKLVSQGDMTPEEFKSMLLNTRYTQVKPHFDRAITNKQGNLTSKPQARTLRELMQYGE